MVKQESKQLNINQFTDFNGSIQPLIDKEYTVSPSGFESSDISFTWSSYDVPGTYIVEITESNNETSGEFRISDDGGDTWFLENIEITLGTPYTVPEIGLSITFQEEGIYAASEVYNLSPSLGSSGQLISKYRHAGCTLYIDYFVIASDLQLLGGQVNLTIPDGFTIDTDRLFNVSSSSFMSATLGVFGFGAVPFLLSVNDNKITIPDESGSIIENIEGNAASVILSVIVPVL